MEPSNNRVRIAYAKEQFYYPITSFHGSNLFAQLEADIIYATETLPESPVEVIKKYGPETGYFLARRKLYDRIDEFLKIYSENKRFDIDTFCPIKSVIGPARAGKYDAILINCYGIYHPGNYSFLDLLIYGTGNKMPKIISRIRKKPNLLERLGQGNYTVKKFPIIVFNHFIEEGDSIDSDILNSEDEFKKHYGADTFIQEINSLKNPLERTIKKLESMLIPA